MNGLDDGGRPKTGAGPRTRVTAFANNKIKFVIFRLQVCYICGRQYGLSSYEIHLKQCKELFIAREAKKDPKERKKLPEDPMLAITLKQSTYTSQSNTSKASATTNGDLDLDEINRLATATFNTETLETCVYCGRTFLAEKLTIHNRSCTADNPARRVNETIKRGSSVVVSEPIPPRTAPTLSGRSGKFASPSDSLNATMSRDGAASGKLSRTAKKVVETDWEDEDEDEEGAELLNQTLLAAEKRALSGSGSGSGPLKSILKGSLSKQQQAQSETKRNKEKKIDEDGDVGGDISLESTVNLQIQGGSAIVVGTLGGAGGRQYRKQQQMQSALSSALSSPASSSSPWPGSPSPSASLPRAISGGGAAVAVSPQAALSLQDKQQVVAYLAESIDYMEGTALGLMRSITEMKALLEDLRDGPRREDGGLDR